MNDAITHQTVTVDELKQDIERIKRHIETAPDEATEICYINTLYKWESRLARALGAEPPNRRYCSRRVRR